MPNALWVHGKDAGEFLQGQLTNEVSNIQINHGNEQARVNRKGKLDFLFYLFSLSEKENNFVAQTQKTAQNKPQETKSNRAPNNIKAPSYLLLLEHSYGGHKVSNLIENLEAFHFAEELEMVSLENKIRWFSLAGPKLETTLQAILSKEGFTQWRDFPEGALWQADILASRGSKCPCLLAKRSITGDPGIIFGFSEKDYQEVSVDLVRVCKDKGFEVYEESLGELSEAEEVIQSLRTEAGRIWTDVDFPMSQRVLPETGREQSLVSYSKGCYLGQEVIARIRTYGSVQYALRGIRLDEKPGIDLDKNIELFNLENKKIGALATVRYSGVFDQWIAYAFLDRENRVPGQELEALVASSKESEEKAKLKGKVVLLPFYQAESHQEKARHKYDLAVERFSERKDEEAMSLLQEALQLNPSFEDAYEILGVILGHHEKFVEAIDFFKRLEEIAPEEPMVNTNLSLYYMKLGDKETAEDHAAQATMKKFSHATGAASAKEREDNFKKAKKEEAERKKSMFLEVLEIDPKDSVALYGLGNVFSTLEDWEKARDYFEKALEVDQQNSALYAECGKAYEKLELPDKALKIYEKGMKVASARGDLMPLKDMENRSLLLKASNR